MRSLRRGSFVSAKMYAYRVPYVRISGWPHCHRWHHFQPLRSAGQPTIHSNLGAHSTRKFWWSAVRPVRLYRWCCHRQRFRIGWRYDFGGRWIRDPSKAGGRVHAGQRSGALAAGLQRDTHAKHRGIRERVYSAGSLLGKEESTAIDLPRSPERVVPHRSRGPRALAGNCSSLPAESLLYAGNDVSSGLVAAARAQVGVTLIYDPSYQQIAYPMGDVPMVRGVCSDVVIRAFRTVGIDLQQELHRDMKRRFAAYPKNWGLAKPDRNIDHRRVPNLATWFKRQGYDSVGQPGCRCLSAGRHRHLGLGWRAAAYRHRVRPALRGWRKAAGDPQYRLNRPGRRRACSNTALPAISAPFRPISAPSPTPGSGLNAATPA